MGKLRIYRNPPYHIAVIHGGPGAGGEMAPVARALAATRGVLEPIQTATSLDGQVEELRMTLEQYGEPPVTLIGYSWGAWLSFIVASRFPALVKKLILVASGPFEEKYVARLLETRLSHLSENERAEFAALIESLGDLSAANPDRLLDRLGALAAKADAYDPITDQPIESGLIVSRGAIFQGVWQAAAELRRSGALLELGRGIRCPVVAIHGDQDPHPAEGVRVPLSSVLRDFRFVLLDECGHTSWMEKRAKESFYRLIKAEAG